MLAYLMGGQRLTPDIVAIRFPSIEAMKDGQGEIRSISALICLRADAAARSHLKTIIKARFRSIK